MASSKKKPVTRWHDGSTPIEDLAANEQLAHEMVSRYRDLAPSVERIMAADLTDGQRNDAARLRFATLWIASATPTGTHEQRSPTPRTFG